MRSFLKAGSSAVCVSQPEPSSVCGQSPQQNVEPAEKYAESKLIKADELTRKWERRSKKAINRQT